MLKNSTPNIRLDLLKNISNPQGVRLGVSANYGAHTNELIAGVVLAIRESNRDVNVLWKNDFRNKNSAIKSAKYFIENNVIAVVGHLSASAALAASKEYHNSGTLYFAPGTTHCDLVTPDRSTTYRVNSRDDLQAEFISSSLKKITNFNPVLLIQDIEYGYSLSELISESLPSATRHVLPLDLENKTNNRIMLNPVTTNSNNPVIICGIHEYAVLCCQYLREQNFQGKIIIGDDGYTGNLIKLGGSNVDGAWVSVCEPIIKPINHSHLDHLNSICYRQLNQEPYGYFLFSYLATTAALSGKFNSQQLSDGVGATIDCPLGTIKFNHNRELEYTNWKWKKIINGSFCPGGGFG